MSTHIDLRQSARRNGEALREGDRPKVLRLIDQLCCDLRRQHVVYCHFKSNEAIDRSAGGENDLDLLVRRADFARFAAILGRLGFREARAPAAGQLPGVVNFFGYDAPSGRLVHVHAHCRLILGHDLTKNYRLPIERPFLESASQEDPFRLPAPEFEMLLFIVRMMLKHSTPDTLLGRDGELSQSERREFAYLQARADLRRLHAIARRHLPRLTPALLDACLRSLRPGCSFWARFRTGRQLQRSLRAYARRGRVSDVWLKLWRRFAKAIRRRVFGRLPRKRLAGGGAMVALVGGDGAGKSTAVGRLYGWLAKDFEVTKVHLGKPARSRTTIVVRGLLKLGRLLYPIGKGRVAALLREVCQARDRYLTYVRARRLAANGHLVICDRYPLPQIKLMDTMRSGWATHATDRGRLSRWLVRIAQRYYRQIRPPELLIVLRIDPEIAVRRKTDECPDEVRTRCREMWQTTWPRSQAHVVDASRPKEEVLCQLKTLVWSHL